MPPKKKPTLPVKLASKAPLKKKKKQDAQKEPESSGGESPASPTPPDENSGNEEGRDPSTSSKKSVAPGSEADIQDMTKRRAKKKALVLTEEQEVDIGEWLRNHPEIFTKKLKAYKDAGKKKKLWQDKALELGVEADLLRVWYQSIRTKIGKLTAKSGAARKDITDRDTFLKQNYGFLTDHISRVRGRTAISLSSQIVSSQLQRQQSSESEMEEEPETIDSSSLAVDQQRPVPTPPADVAPTPTTTSKGKGRGKTTKKSDRTGPRSDEEEEAAITDLLRKQQQDAGRLQGQIASLLDRDQATAMTSFGTFIGRLGLQIDDRLLDGYYREVLHVTLRTIERSRSLPGLAPPPPPPPQFPPMTQQFMQPQPYQPPQQTYTTLQGQYQPQHEQQQGTPTDTQPGTSTGTWDTFNPQAGQNLATPVVPPRPQSTPNLSFPSLPRLSDLSQSLMTPENPTERRKSPTTDTGPGGFFMN